MSSVRKRKYRTKEGIEHFYWMVDYYIDGQRYTQGGFGTKLEAEEFRTDLKNKTKEKDSVDKCLTLRDAANNFMELYAEIHCKPSTIEFYDVIFKRHLIPFFGNKKVYSIKSELINEYIKLKIDEELSPKTINHHLTLLSNLFQKLIDTDRLMFNPVAKVKRLKLQHIEMSFLKFEDVKKLLNCCKEHYPDFYPLLMLAIFTGMRKGEMMALTWNDINLKTGKIQVNKAIYKGNVSTPKTMKSIRKVDMPKSLVNTFKEYKLQSQNNEQELVFCNQEGKHLDPDNIIKRRFDPCLRKAGIDKVRFHDLRHTYASMLIAKNVPIKYIQSQLGHSSIQITLDRYGHIMPDIHDQAVSVLDNVIGHEVKKRKRKTRRRKRNPVNKVKLRVV